MDKKTKGAWLVSHSRKIQTTDSQDFDQIAFAGKCGTLLSAISGQNQSQLTQKKVEALARANSISPRSELPSIIVELNKQRLISSSNSGIEVLGLTSHSVLEHTSTIFEESTPESYEAAIIELSEIISENPVTDKSALEYLSDEFKLTKIIATNTLNQGGHIGFFDSENISSSEQLLFNGNLFRREDASKINAILSNLNASESQLAVNLNAELQNVGCMSLKAVETSLGKDLFSKLHSIGMYDVSVVGNDSGKNYFVTRPSAFSKFSNSIADDALDLSKALVASLTYGMTISSYYRGQIRMISALMNKLIAGSEVGPATAIGNDYQALELKGVIKVTPSKNGMFTMKLLKPEVGKLALTVIQDGDITTQAISQLPSAKITEYIAPEQNRVIHRKHMNEAVKLKAANMLNEIRTGGILR